MHNYVVPYLYSATNEKSSIGEHVYEDVNENLKNRYVLKRIKSIAKNRKKRTSSNPYRNPLQLPERKYLEDPDFVKELESSTEEAPTIPERNYMDDTQFVYDLNAELFPDIPELPARYYLEDAEFLADLKDDSQVAAASLQDSSEGDIEHLQDSTEGDTQHLQDSTEGDTQRLQDSSGGDIEHLQDSSGGDTQHLQDSSGGDIEHLQDSTEGDTQHLQDSSGGDIKHLQDSSEDDTEQLFVNCGNNVTSQEALSPEHSDRKNVSSESDKESVLSMHANKESMAAGQYMSLCEATKTTQGERENNYPQEGAYMSLHNTISEKQEGVDKKSHHYSESEYTSLQLEKLPVVDERKSDSNEQYMSLNESTREKEIFTSGAALRIIQAEN